MNSETSLRSSIPKDGAYPPAFGPRDEQHFKSLPLELAADVERSTSPAYATGTEYLPLPDRIRHAVERVSAETTVPAQVLVLAAWCLVLQRHTARSDVVVEVSEPGRAGRSASSLLTVTVDPDHSFARIAAQIHDVLSGSDAERRHERCAEDAPVPVRFVLAPSTAEPAIIPEAGTVAPEIGFTVADPAVQPVLHITYHSGLFERDTIAALLRDGATLLSEALHAPAAPVHTLRMRPVADRPTAWELPLPAGFTAPEAPGPAECLTDRFSAVAVGHGDRVAVTGPSGTYTYSELDAATTALARRLRRLVAPGSRIALLAGHDTGVALGVWAVLKAGCAYVPLDPRQPHARLARMTSGSRVAAVVCDVSLTGQAALLAKRRPVVPLTAVPLIDEDEDTSGGSPLSGGDPDSPAYLLHTSGTTGRPKAVVQTRRNVLAHATTYAARIGIGPAENVSLLPRISSDAAVMDLFAAHLTGAALHVIDPQTPARQLRAAVDRAAVSVLHCTPTLLRHLLDPAAAVKGPFAELAQVRVVVLGGEETTRGDLERFRSGFRDSCHLVNGFGPTECTVAFQHLARPEDGRRPAVPMGHPVDGVSFRLLDDRLRTTDVFGEVEIVSDRVAAGYWDDEAATAAVFGRSPDGPAAYRTGDLARRLPDGRLVFVGRKDRQVKIRGHRVEPDEVQAVLRAHPTVGQAAVEVDRSLPGGPRLVGYVTASTAMPVDAHELLGYLERNVPDHAVPWQVVVLSTMPVGPTGKVDRARLPPPTAKTTDLTDEETRTPLEREIAALWCEVLGLVSMGVHSDWMRCGGDSLQLMTMLDRVKETWEADVPLIDFLRQPTVAALAELVENRQPDAGLG